MAGLEGTLEILSGINAPIFVCLGYKRILTFFQNKLETLSLGLLAWWTTQCDVNWWADSGAPSNHFILLSVFSSSLNM